ncbi:MAG: DUF2225 domain-containing protein [candidate division Zixibacteria bacterium]|nr:DUF2225 domain-containing protein [candidate division Zixibacteria bacterium]
MDSPIFLTKVECPVCGTVNEIETIRVGAYTEGERQTDFCPTIIKWRNPRYQRYHPLLYFTATCSHCYYTREFNNSFREWSKDNNFRAYKLKITKERHLEELSEPESFIKLVANVLDQENYPDETAILKLMLAAHDELFHDHPSELDLGRFYLRIAWLFRYINAGNDSDSSPGKPAPSHIDDIQRGIEDLNNWIGGLTRNTGYLNDAVIAQCDLSGNADERENYTGCIDELKMLEDTGNKIVTKLSNLLAESKTSAGISVDVGSGETFHNYSSLGEFLSALKRVWDGVPPNEHEAMRLAVKYYIGAFESGKQIAHGNQTLQAAYLIGELSRQVGDHDTARQYFNTTIKTGQAFIHEIRGDRSRTALARKILEMAMKQGKKNLAEAKS